MQVVQDDAVRGRGAERDPAERHAGGAAGAGEDVEEAFAGLGFGRAGGLGGELDVQAIEDGAEAEADGGGVDVDRAEATVGAKVVGVVIGGGVVGRGAWAEDDGVEADGGDEVGQAVDAGVVEEDVGAHGWQRSQASG